MGSDFRNGITLAWSNPSEIDFNPLVKIERQDATGICDARIMRGKTSKEFI